MQWSPRTEAEWLRCGTPYLLVTALEGRCRNWKADWFGWLGFRHGKVSERKLRLVACACCRRIWHLLLDERSRRAVEVSQRFGDGLASEQEVQAAAAAAWEVQDFPASVAAFRTAAGHWVGAAGEARSAVLTAVRRSARGKPGARAAERAAFEAERQA